MHLQSLAARVASTSVCALLMFALSAVIASSASALITVHTLNTPFNKPIGLQYDEEENELLLSVNYPNGLPHNFELVNTAGADTQFGTVSGLTDEIYLAAIRNTSGCPEAGGFKEGEVYYGTGKPGQIDRIRHDGATPEVFANLSPESGTLRGGIAQGCLGPFSGDLVVSTASGDVWKVPFSGPPVELAANVGPVDGTPTTTEGPTTVPNEARYGPWAGTILVASEECGCVESIDSSGNVKQYKGYTASTGQGAEGVRVVPANEYFYAVDYTDSKIIGISPTELLPYVGDVFVYTEQKGKIFDVRWNASANGGNGAFEKQEVITPVGQLEGSTFAPIALPPFCAESCEHWLSDGKPIPEGQSEKVKTKGKLTFLINGQYPCTTNVTDEETILNPVGGGTGTDEVTSFNIAPCKKSKGAPCPNGYELVAQKLPWKSHLLGGTPEPDPTEGMTLEVKCHGQLLSTYTGTLTPLLGESTLEFNERSGELREALPGHPGEFGPGTLSVSGIDKLTGPKGDTKITSGQPTKNVWNIEKTQTISWGKLTFTWSRTVDEGGSNAETAEIEAACRKAGYVGMEFENCVTEREDAVRGELDKRCEEEIAEGRYKSFEECSQAHEARKETLALTCKKSDAGNIWNSELGLGLDETVLFDLYECSSEQCLAPVVTASRLPWPSSLEEAPVGTGVIRDRTRGIALSVECQAGKSGGAFAETFTGELAPRWRNGSATTGPSYDEFDEASGVLTGEPGNELRITGNDYMAGFEKGELITASTVFSKGTK